MYPKDIKNRIKSIKRSVLTAEPSATGRAVTFLCGVFVEFELLIDGDQGVINEALFRTNGCGYILAVADLVANSVTSTKLAELHGVHELQNEAIEQLGEAPDGRIHCFEICFVALQNALADYRLTRVEGWNGDDALVCSCFGVSEAEIEAMIESEKLGTVEEVGEACNAGTGCGSCQPIIQEILDL